MPTPKLHCNTCDGERNHSTLSEHSHEWKEEVDFDEEFGPSYISGKDTYMLLRCMGCNSVSLEYRSYVSEADRVTIQLYPPRQFRRMPIWFHEVDGILAPDDIAFIPRLLKEIYGSLYAEHRAVSAMGIRALLELIMINKIGDKGSFAKNVEAFQAAGFISTVQKELLEPTFEFGHASMHRNHAPRMNELVTALDITESLIHTLYVLPDKAKLLSKAVPKRK